MNKNIVISTNSILAFFGILLAGWLLYQVRVVLLIAYVSIIFTLALDPFVTKLQTKVRRRGVAVSIVVVSLFLVFATALSLGVSSIVTQTGSFISGFPSLVYSVFDYFGYPQVGDQVLVSLTKNLASNSDGMVTFTKGVFSNAIGVFSVFMFTFYFLLDFEKLKNSFLSFFSDKTRENVSAIVGDIETQLGSWMRGQLFLMLIVGAMSFIGLSLLQVKYALPLAFLAGLLEVIPNIGPTISAIPAVLVALTVSPWLALGTLALYILIQQLENNLIVPKVMQRALGFNPLTTILAILIGGRLLGVIGGVLALPSLLSVLIILRHITRRDINL